MEQEALKSGTVVSVTQSIPRDDQTKIRHYGHGVVRELTSSGAFIDFGVLQGTPKSPGRCAVPLKKFYEIVITYTGKKDVTISTDKQCFKIEGFSMPCHRW